MKKDIFKKIWHIVKEHKALRTSVVLNAVFLLFILIFLLFSISYGRQNNIYKDTIKQNKQTLSNLQRMTTVMQNKEKISISPVSNKTFMSSDAVIPFITYLEGIFSKADSKAEISVKSQENQISTDHYADYKISLKNPHEKLFFDSLDKLYDSSYITNMMVFSIFYDDTNKDGINIMDRAEFDIRLFLK